MSKPKTYTLELTAEELANVSLQDDGDGDALEIKLRMLAKQAMADRAGGSIAAPWKAAHVPRAGWYVHKHGDMQGSLWVTEEQAKLASAAPELLEVAQKAGRVDTKELQRLIARALRKVETGTPEEP